MYFLDPETGRRRRARTRDQALHAGRVLNEAGKVTARDTVHRAQGVVASTKRLFQRGEVSDEALVGRVRAALGRVVSHPHAVDVAVEGGYVTLTGPILTHESRELLACVRKVAGVRAVSDQLTVYEHPEHIPALQGGIPRHGGRPEFLQQNWSPAARLVAGVTGAGLMALGSGQRGMLGTVFGIAGGGLLARAATNYDLRSLVGLGRRGITVQKVINVNAPPQHVFTFWTDYQNFPRFMSRVRDVHPMAERRSHWVVSGPAGVPVQWTAEVTRVIVDRLIEWRSTRNSDIRHEGAVRFEPNGQAGTRVHVRLTYVPPAGAFGHAVAQIFGADPKSEMDADLLRMKTVIETGRTPHDAARPISRES
jgi:uncharacterized membrane protein